MMHLLNLFKRVSLMEVVNKFNAIAQRNFFHYMKKKTKCRNKKFDGQQRF